MNRVLLCFIVFSFEGGASATGEEGGRGRRTAAYKVGTDRGRLFS